MTTFYVEKEVKDHFRTKKILEKFSKKRIVFIDKYTEIFNRNNQNYLLQKNHPSFILAKKRGTFVQRIKSESGLGSLHNFYFSPLLNCPFDCQYCFLKGLYRSAFYLFFVNIEEFQEEIGKTIFEFPDSYFFSGYDADSLALDEITEINRPFINFFRDKKGFLELRTKSINISSLLKTEPLKNLIVAYSLSPENLINAFEKKTPSLEMRIKALNELQNKGFLIGLRFDPLIYHENFQKSYRDFFQKVFSSLKTDTIHSVTIGTLRYPKSCFQNMQKNDPKNFLLAPLFENELGIFSYDRQKSGNLYAFCSDEISKYFPAEKTYILKECS